MTDTKKGEWVDDPPNDGWVDDPVDTSALNPQLDLFKGQEFNPIPPPPPAWQGLRKEVIGEAPKPIRLPIGWNTPSISARSGPPITGPSEQEIDDLRHRILGEDYTPKNEANLNLFDLAKAIPGVAASRRNESYLGDLPSQGADVVSNIINPYGDKGTIPAKIVAAIPRIGAKFLEGSTTGTNLALGAGISGLFNYAKTAAPEAGVLVDYARRAIPFLSRGEAIPAELEVERQILNKMIAKGALAKISANLLAGGAASYYGAENFKALKDAQTPEDAVAALLGMGLGVWGGVEGLRRAYGATKSQRINPPYGEPTNVTPPTLPAAPTPDFTTSKGIAAEALRIASGEAGESPKPVEIKPTEPSPSMTINVDETGRATLPEGWVEEVGKTRGNVPGQVIVPRSGEPGKVTYRDEEQKNRPLTVNHEAAHAYLSALPQTQRDALLKLYMNSKMHSPQWKKYGVDYMVRNKYHIEDLITDIGTYLTHPDLLDPRIKKLFDSQIRVNTPQRATQDQNFIEKLPLKTGDTELDTLIRQLKILNIREKTGSLTNRELENYNALMDMVRMHPKMPAVIEKEWKATEATPDRRLKFGRGANGLVDVVVPDANHKLLLQWAAQSHKQMRTGSPAPYSLSERAKELASRFGVDPSKIPGMALKYKQQISNAVKGLEEGSTYEAPKWDEGEITGEHERVGGKLLPSEDLTPNEYERYTKNLDDMLRASYGEDTEMGQQAVDEMNGVIDTMSNEQRADLNELKRATDAGLVPTGAAWFAAHPKRFDAQGNFIGDRASIDAGPDIAAYENTRKELVQRLINERGLSLQRAQAEVDRVYPPDFAKKLVELRGKDIVGEHELVPKRKNGSYKTIKLEDFAPIGEHEVTDKRELGFITSNGDVQTSPVPKEMDDLDYSHRDAFGRITDVIPARKRFIFKNNKIFWNERPTSEDMVAADNHYGGVEQFYQTGFQSNEYAPIKISPTTDDFVGEHEKKWAKNFAPASIGYIDSYGGVHTELATDDPTALSHRDFFGDENIIGVPENKKFRYNKGIVTWEGKPSADDFFAVDNKFGSPNHVYYTKGYGERPLTVNDYPPEAENALRIFRDRSSNPPVEPKESLKKIFYTRPQDGFTHVIFDPFDIFTDTERAELERNPVLNEVAKVADDYIRDIMRTFPDAFKNRIVKQFGFTFHDKVYGTNIHQKGKNEHVVLSNIHTIFSDAGNDVYDGVAGLLNNIDHEMIHSLGVGHDDPTVFDELLSTLRANTDISRRLEYAYRIIDHIAGKGSGYSAEIQDILSKTNAAIRRRTGAQRIEIREDAFEGLNAPRTRNSPSDNESGGEGTVRRTPRSVRIPVKGLDHKGVTEQIDSKYMAGYTFDHIDKNGDVIMSRPTSGDVGERLRAALEDAKDAAEIQQEMNREGHRLQAERRRAVRVGGQVGAAQRLAAMGGSFDKAGMEPFKLPQEDIDTLFDTIHNRTINGDTFVGAHAEKALFKMMEGIAPTNSERKALESILDIDLSDIYEYHGYEPGVSLPVIDLRKRGETKWGSIVAEGVNIFRTLQTAFDISAPFGQGVGAFYHGSWRRAWGVMVRSVGSEAAFRDAINAIKERPEFQGFRDSRGKVHKSLAETAGLRITDLTEKLENREEDRASTWAESGEFLDKDIPYITKGYAMTVGRGVRASNRAYTAYLDTVRADLFSDVLRRCIFHYQNVLETGRTGAFGFTSLSTVPGLSRRVSDVEKFNPLTNERLLKQIGSFVNTATMTTRLPKQAEKGAVLLNAILYAPRMLVAQHKMLWNIPLNPIQYVYMNPVVRRQYFKSWLGMAAMWVGFASIAKFAGAEVVMDPHRADFLSFKWGNIRFNPIGGMKSVLVLYTRLATHMFTSSTTGKSYEMGQRYGQKTERDIINDFVSNRFAPIPGALQGTGGYFARSRYNPFGVGDKAATMVTPFVAQDIAQIARENPWLIAPATVAGLIGIRMSTYGGKGASYTFIPPEHDLVLPKNAKIKK